MAYVDERDWASLPPELVGLIATGIKICSDYVRFRAVCNPWRSSTPAKPTHLPRQLPWMLFPPSPVPRGGIETSGGEYCSISEATSNQTAGLVIHSHLRLPEPFPHYLWRFRGSSHGWIFILDTSLSVVILNPLTGAKLSLPPVSGLPELSIWCAFSGMYSHLSRNRRKSIRKLALSDSPARNSDFIALAILDEVNDILFCKSGQDNWTKVPEDILTEDAVFFQEMVFAMDCFGYIYIYIYDVRCDPPGVLLWREQIEGLDNFGIIDTYRLVPLRNELLLVTRFFDSKQMDSYQNLSKIDQKETGFYPTVKFEVHRLDLVGKRWERVGDLGEDVALFVGGNSCSSALVISDFPGCRGNSIYFTEEDLEGKLESNHAVRHDMGIFSLEDGTFQRFSLDLRLSNEDGFTPHPIWFTPDPF